MQQEIIVCLLIACTVAIPAGTSGQTLSSNESVSISECDGEWNRTYGGSQWERANGVVPTGNGYMLVGPTESYGPGPESAMAVKTDGQGNERWNRTYGSRDIDIPAGVVRAEDGYVVTGIYSFGEGLGKVWLFKIDEWGKMLWNRTCMRDPVNTSIAHHVARTADGGYIVAGRCVNTSGNQSYCEIGAAPL